MNFFQKKLDRRRFKSYVSTSLVALPTQTINNPVAIGSRVPACPTYIRNRRVEKEKLADLLGIT